MKCARVTLLCVLAFMLTTGGCAMAAATPEPVWLEPAASAPGLSGEYAEAPAEPPGGRGGADLTAAQTASTIERLVIRTADLELIVPDTEQALERIRGMVAELDGYVVSMTTYQLDRGVQASVTIRVPAESFDAALAQLKGLATTVRRESVSGQDVTEEYVDLESRLRHLRAKEDQLLQFLDQAEDTEATLAVYEQLSYTQQEIEQVSGRMKYLENQAALSTISISLTPDALAQPLETGGWNLPGTVRGAVEALLGVLEFFVKALIVFFIVGLPTLILFAIPIVLLILLIRWLVRRRKRSRGAA